MKTWHVLLPAALLCGGLFLEGRRQRATNDRLEAELRQVSAQVAADGDSAAKNEMRSALLGSMLSRPAPAEAPAASEAGRPIPATRDAAKPPSSPEEVIAHAELSFQREPIDPAWAAGTQREVSQKLSAFTSQKLALRSLECKSASCRAELSYVDPAAFETFAKEALTSFERPIWPGGLYMPPPEKRGENEMVAVVYLMKDGTGLLPVD